MRKFVQPLVFLILVGFGRGAETPFGIPDDALEFDRFFTGDTPTAGAQFGYSMDGAWPILAVGSFDRETELGSVSVFFIEEEAEEQPGVIELAKIGVPIQPTAAGVGAAVSVTRVEPEDFGHWDSGSTEWQIAVPGSSILALWRVTYNVTLGRFNEPEPYVQPSTGCAEYSFVSCRPPLDISLRGGQIVLTREDYTVEMLEIAGVFAQYYVSAAYTLPDDENSNEEFGASCLSTGGTLTTSTYYVGSPAASSSQLESVGRVRIRSQEEDVKDLPRTVVNTVLEENRFGAAMSAPFHGLEKSFVVTSPLVEGSIHVYSSGSTGGSGSLYKHDPVEVAFEHNPYAGDGLPWGTSVDCEVYRTETEFWGTGSGYADLFIAVGSMRSSLDRNGLVDLYMKVNIDRLDNDRLFKVNSFYAPETSVLDHFGTAVTTLVDPDSGDVWLFLSAPGFDYDDLEDSGAVWVKRVDPPTYVDWSRIAMYSAAAVVGVGLLAGGGWYFSKKSSSSPSVGGGDSQSEKTALSTPSLMGAQTVETSTMNGAKRAPPSSSGRSTGSKGSRKKGGSSRGSRRSKGSRRAANSETSV